MTDTELFSLDDATIPEWLETSRLILRPITHADEPAITAAKLLSRDHLKPWFSWAQKNEEFTSEANNAFIDFAESEWNARNNFMYFAFEKETGAFVTATGILVKSLPVRRYEVSYWTPINAVGKGYARESANVMTRIAFDFLNAASVMIRMNPLNEKSRKVAERLGYDFEGILRRSYPCPVTGNPRDTAHYSCIDTNALPPLEYKVK